MFLRLVFISFPFLLSVYGHGGERFPRPEFSGDYRIPDTELPSPPSFLSEWIDVVLLIIALGLSAKFAIFDRSRKRLVFLLLACLAYFGFYKHGCVCSIGALQNFVLSLFSNDYSLPLSIFFLLILPPLFSLYFGRVFCGAACPLGALQDIFALRPVHMPVWARECLGLARYFYLAFALLFAATGSGFIICRADPFVSFFRLSGAWKTILSGSIVLLASVFVARPYCRFLCPYGLMLGWFAKLAKWRLKICAGECVKCGNCVNACPFDAIEVPTTKNYPGNVARDARRLLFLILLFPFILLSMTYAGIKFSSALSRRNSLVRLAEQIRYEESAGIKSNALESSVFRNAGKENSELFAEAEEIRKNFIRGGIFCGLFLGVALCGRLFSLAVWRRREFPEPDTEACLVCSRCQQACPVNKKANIFKP